FVGEGPEPRQIAVSRPHHTDVLQYRLGDHGRDRVALAHIAHGFQIVEVHRVHEMRAFDGGSGTDWAQRIFARRYPRSDLGNRIDDVAREFILIAVVSALHHDEM